MVDKSFFFLHTISITFHFKIFSHIFIFIDSHWSFTFFCVNKYFDLWIRSDCYSIDFSGKFSQFFHRFHLAKSGDYILLAYKNFCERYDWTRVKRLNMSPERWTTPYYMNPRVFFTHYHTIKPTEFIERIVCSCVRHFYYYSWYSLLIECIISIELVWVSEWFFVYRNWESFCYFDERYMRFTAEGKRSMLHAIINDKFIIIIIICSFDASNVLLLKWLINLEPLCNKIYAQTLQDDIANVVIDRVRYK